MLKAYVLAAGVVFGFTAPAFSADYYIVHGPDRHCRVVERLPEDRTIVRVGPLRFGTRDEAERQVMTVCRDHGYYR